MYMHTPCLSKRLVPAFHPIRIFLLVSVLTASNAQAQVTPQDKVVTLTTDSSIVTPTDTLAHTPPKRNIVTKLIDYFRNSNKQRPEKKSRLRCTARTALLRNNRFRTWHLRYSYLYNRFGRQVSATLQCLGLYRYDYWRFLFSWVKR